MKLIFPVSLAALLLAALPIRADVSQSEMNYGYGLLHHLCDDETQVDMISLVKTTPPSVDKFVHEIAQNAKDDMDILGKFADHDPSIQYDRQGLPEMETQTRAAIKAEKQHLLLFGSKDSDFAKTLIVSQIEASTYGENLAKVLADNETNPHRATELRHIASGWQTIKTKAYALLYKL
jgi:hypothetical protein